MPNTRGGGAGVWQVFSRCSRGTHQMPTHPERRGFHLAMLPKHLCPTFSVCPRASWSTNPIGMSPTGSSCQACQTRALWWAGVWQALGKWLAGAAKETVCACGGQNVGCCSSTKSSRGCHPVAGPLRAGRHLIHPTRWRQGGGWDHQPEERGGSVLDLRPTGMRGSKTPDGCFNTIHSTRGKQNVVGFMQPCVRVFGDTTVCFGLGQSTPVHRQKGCRC